MNWINVQSEKWTLLNSLLTAESIVPRCSAKKNIYVEDPFLIKLQTEDLNIKKETPKQGFPRNFGVVF